MNKMNSSLRRTFLMLGYLGILGFLLACTTLGIGSSAVQQGMLQLDQGIVKVQDPQGNWEPLAGTSTFELVGKLEGTNPWTVAGRSLVTNELDPNRTGTAGWRRGARSRRIPGKW